MQFKLTYNYSNGDSDFRIVTAQEAEWMTPFATVSEGIVKSITIEAL